ncbi:MAG: CPBP family intramembrane metalloprotease [Clostridiales Family XIII bacterium]|jgi:membrane protease YdiL (CAAX protease family)|nr:CPBP family intramembrane metalloprotease [Clostridiales Family XIII bacterium]
MMNYDNNYFDWALFRRDVRRDIRDCALFLFLFYAINIVATVVIETTIVLRKALGSIFISGDFSIDTITQAATDGNTLAIISIVGIVAGGMAFMIRRKKRFFTDLALPAAEPLRPWIFILLVVVTQGIQYATGAISTFVEYLLPEGISIVGNYDALVGMLFTPLGLVYVILIGPVFEELIFRGAIMGPLRKYGDNFAILFSSLLFGLYHGVVLQMPFAFAMGLVLGYACTRWSLRTSIALHILTNGISVLISTEALAIPGGIALLFCGVLTLILFFVFRRQLMVRIREGRPYYGSTTYANGFASIAFWLFAAAMIGFAIAQLFGVTELQ